MQMELCLYPARMGDIFIFTPGTFMRCGRPRGQSMEYENIIFELELLGGGETLCAEKYIFPLQSGRLALTGHLTPNEDICAIFPLRPVCGRWKMPTTPNAPAMN